MGLSSNSLIHFTNTKEKLIGILTENFKPKFCLEKIWFENDIHVPYAAPMVSFCDIPFSEVKNHLSNYGPYGIGLTKTWAEKNSLNPVIYLSKDSALSKSYWQVYQKYLLESKKTLDKLDEHELSVLDLVRYMKNYQGDLIRAGKVVKNYRYSDEREWRYVPPYAKEYSMILAGKDYDNENKKKTKNDSLGHIRLSFEPNDIKYIIIEKDSEISEFVSLLRGSKGKKYAYDDVERLMTRLVTTEQIVSDF
jgi:hypothetical protein